MLQIDEPNGLICNIAQMNKCCEQPLQEVNHVLWLDVWLTWYGNVGVAEEKYTDSFLLVITT